MFGTLVIVLPSAHCGGELIIRHAGRETTVDLSGGEVSELAFAAFYADCEHEVRPITQGSRVCLAYNLIQRQSRKKDHRVPDSGARHDRGLSSKPALAREPTHDEEAR
jgi:predicted 2-oxoglutarate/Fe(II)-dependent dioxygenase YbiX